MRPWHKKSELRAFWDPAINDGEGAEREILQTLKERLANPNGMKIQELIVDIARGVHMCMDAIDQLDYKRTGIKDERRR